MVTDPKVLAWWRALLAEAWKSNEQPFLFFFTIPRTEIRTRELDADGKRVVEYTWHAVPGEVRQEIVDLLVNRPFLKRGKQPAFDRGTAGIIRSLHDIATSEHNPDRKTKTQSMNDLAKRFNVKPSTMRDLIDQRKTYAAKKELKETKRVRRKT